MIRPMAAQDIPFLIALGAEMHNESQYANLDFDPQKLFALGEAMLESPDLWLALVVELDSKIVGFCFGFVTPHFFGNDLTSGDLAIYISPEHRKGSTGVSLVKQYDAWCVKMGVKEPLLGVSSGIAPDRVGRLYERLGYTDKYTIYKKPSFNI